MIPWNDYFLVFPRIPSYNQQPPTVYSILESIVNYDKEPKTKVKDLAKEGRGKIFNFDYPLTNLITKEKFETMILNHFLMRRIGFETVTLFSIQLDIKLNEIMPLYNKMFESVENWDIFNDGEITEKTGTDNRIIDNTAETSNTLENQSTTRSNEISDRRNSELPQDQLELLRDGSYVSNYSYDQNNGESTDNSSSNGTSNSKNNTKDDNQYHEIVKRSPADKIAIYKEFQENINSIYGMIFKELECLFYQLV
jgi:hypothetical protein